MLKPMPSQESPVTSPEMGRKRYHYYNHHQPRHINNNNRHSEPDSGNINARSSLGPNSSRFSGSRWAYFENPPLLLSVISRSVTSPPQVCIEWRHRSWDNSFIGEGAMQSPPSISTIWFFKIVTRNRTRLSRQGTLFGTRTRIGRRLFSSLRQRHIR